jgi:hypothetical protein
LDIETNPIPTRHTLDAQGAFVMGYYHQRAAFYTPKANGAAQPTDSDTNQVERNNQ